MIDQYQNLLNIISFIFIILLLIWVIVLNISIKKIKEKQSILFKGKKAKNLEEIVIENRNNIASNQKDIEKIYRISSKNNYLAGKALHKTGLVRFNPFRDIGGDQSFSLALLDKDNNGVIISSLYSREGVRVYSKAIKSGESMKYPLTEEEKQAISIASIKKSNS